jgi:outer membrane protein OmpA-like peptidoglycan-associated protein
VTIATLIKDQGSVLSSIAPSGLAPVLGIGHCGEVVPAPKASIGPPPAPVREPAREPESGLGWLQWLLPLLLIPLLFVGWRSCRPAPVREVATPAQTTAPAPTPTPAPAATVLVKHTLSCGQTLEVAERGIEKQLVAFVDDQGAAIDPDRWFSFDRLEFETDSAVLQPSSRAQLRNIVEIMQCYPNLELKVGGYTDSTGDDAYNLKLSQERAESTMRALIDLGAPAARLSAEGYGEQYPVASNDTDEGRQRNRRIDLSVRKK